MKERKEDGAQVRRVYAREGAPIETLIVRWLAARLGAR